MHGFGAGLPGGIDDGVDAEIAVLRRCRTDQHGLVGERDMQRIAIGLGEYRHRSQAHAFGRANDPAGDLAAVRDQELFEATGERHHHILNMPNRVGSGGGALSSRGERKTQHGAGIGGIDDAVVPDAGGRVIGMALPLVLLADRRLERLLVGRAPVAALGLGRLLAQQPQNGSSLLAAHDRDARIRPHPEEARGVGAPAHAVIAGAVAAADDHGVFRHVGGGDRGHHLGAVLGDAARLVFAPDHEAGDVLQEQQRNVALARQLDEMRALERALAEQDAVVGEDADGIAVNVRKAADERLAVERLELLELGAVDDARDDVADVVGRARVGGNDAVELLRGEQGLARLADFEI